MKFVAKDYVCEYVVNATTILVWEVSSIITITSSGAARYHRDDCSAHISYESSIAMLESFLNGEISKINFSPHPAIYFSLFSSPPICPKVSLWVFWKYFGKAFHIIPQITIILHAWNERKSIAFPSHVLSVYFLHTFFSISKNSPMKNCFATRKSLQFFQLIVGAAFDSWLVCALLFSPELVNKNFNYSFDDGSREQLGAPSIYYSYFSMERGGSTSKL